MNLKKKIDTIDFEEDAKIPRMDIFFEKVQAFMEWCNEQGIYINYEKVGKFTTSVSLSRINPIFNIMKQYS
jgi:hypothetical protein